MSDTEILPCPFCGQVPTTFDTTGNGKWGFVQCCINGPEVRASYAPLEEWRERAIAEWNDRKAAQLAAPARQEMWVVSKGANEMLFHTEDAAERYIAGLPAPRSKGWEIGKLPVYAAPQGEGK